MNDGTSSLGIASGRIYKHPVHQPLGVMNFHKSTQVYPTSYARAGFFY